MNVRFFKLSCAALVAVLSLLAADFASAHHVLGRPSYALNEDSNTPPAVQGEAEIGDFIVTYMVFPAFPRPGEPGRINFYIKSHKDQTPFQGKVTFEIREATWLPWLFGDGHTTILGTQPPDDNVFRQGITYPEEGEYAVFAIFESGGEPYIVEFPLRIGTPMPMSYLFALGLLALLGFVVIQRRRTMTGKLRTLHADGSDA
jgi:hypothetical protein